jgi:hypothetical protein
MSGTGSPLVAVMFRPKPSNVSSEADVIPAKAVQKITLSPSWHIPFDKPVFSQSNVRRVKAGVSIEPLAERIAQRTPLPERSGRRRCGGQRDRYIRGVSRW